LKTRTSWNTHINKRKQANKICAQKKKKWLSNKIIQIEENHRRNETKKFFEGIRNFKQQNILPVICKDDEDNIISQTDLIFSRWTDYFCKILNKSEALDIQNTEKVCANNESQIPLPSHNEICSIIN
jgi:hypothetical protein